MSIVPDDARAAMRATMRAAGGAATAAGWAALWQNKMMTWDLGEPTAVLLAEVEAEMAAGRLPSAPACTALVPGCGSAYDVSALAERGLKAVVGVDFAPEAIEKARTVCGDAANVRLVCADFFAPHDALPDASFDFVFDYTMFCAITPAQRTTWGERCAFFSLSVYSLGCLCIETFVFYVCCAAWRAYCGQAVDC